MGRPIKPLQVIMGNGNSSHLTKKEILDRKNREIVVDKDKVEAPSYLDEKLINEYDKIAAELVKVELITNLDVDTLARYIILYDQYINIIKELRKEKPIITIDGVRLYNENYKELLNAEIKLTKEIRVLATDLGLTLGARLKLVIPKKDEKKEYSSEGDKLFRDTI